MQLTETEMFVIMTERFYNYQNACEFKEQKTFAETLKSFVELFTKGHSTIKPKEEPKPQSLYDILSAQIAQATAEGNLEAVTVYSQALQRI